MYEGFEQKPLVITSNSCDVWLAGFIFFEMMNLELIFTICDQELLCEPWRTWITNRYSWIHHSIRQDFESIVLQIGRVSFLLKMI